MVRALMGSEQDPFCRALEAAVTRWAREVWVAKNSGPFHQDHVTMGELSQALRFGQQRMGPGLAWDQAGPTAAYLRALHAVGWDAVGPVQIKDEGGQLLDLLTGSPMMLRKIFRARWQVMLDLEATQPDLDMLAKLGHADLELMQN